MVTDPLSYWLQPDVVDVERFRHFVKVPAAKVVVKLGRTKEA